MKDMLSRAEIYLLAAILFSAAHLAVIRPAAAQQIVKVEKFRPGVQSETVVLPAHPRFTRIHDTFIFDFHMGMGVAWGDYDGDGWPDLFISGYQRHPDLLYRNKGDGTLTHTETMAGIDAGPAAGFGCGWADYDNDGKLDLYVVNVNEQQDFMWKNNGDGTFRNVAAQVGMDQRTNNYGVAWGDYDGDGYLDLFLVGGNKQSILYHNMGNGTFMDVAAKCGMGDMNVAGFGAAWGDYDGDRDLDLYVTRGGNDFLYRNNGNGTFTNVAAEAGIVESSSGQGVAWGDYDNDGDLDIYVANYSGQQDFLYRNTGDGTFVQVAEKVGMKDNLSGRGVVWADYDNDGDLDLFVANDQGQDLILYRNNGNGTFSNVTKETGLEGGWCIGTAWADYDNDGDLDPFVGTQVTHVDLLYQNEDTGIYNWIKVNPLTAGAGAAKQDYGVCPTCSRPLDRPIPGISAREAATSGQAYRLAIGAWVEVDLDGGADFEKGPGRYVAALVGTGDGLANSAVPLHFGVGTAKTVDVRVSYPTGKVVKLTKVAVKQMITVKDR